MYATAVTEASQARLEKQFSLKLTRHDVSRVADWVEHLTALWDDDKHELKRNLKPDEAEFVRNERLLAAIDFTYWSERYCWFIADPETGGGLQRLKLWESQRIIMALVSKLEREMTEAVARGEPVAGILIAIHKARQLGATMLWRALIIHRVTTSKYQRALTASVNEDKVQQLYNRDQRILEHLPWYLKPSVGYDEKRQHILFDKLDSTVLYQEYAQKSGLGEGEQWDIGHMTETGMLNTNFLEKEYFPTIPRSPSALHGMESRAYGRNNWWHRFITDIRKGGSRWRFCFVPWYAELTKYRAQPPVNWTPSEVAMAHAMKVNETSSEFVGHKVMLPKANLYWWETTRAEYQRKGDLSSFLEQYCATPEESFQHTTQSIFSPEMLDRLRVAASPGVPYEMQVQP